MPYPLAVGVEHRLFEPAPYTRVTHKGAHKREGQERQDSNPGGGENHDDHVGSMAQPERAPRCRAASTRVRATFLTSVPSEPCRTRSHPLPHDRLRCTHRGPKWLVYRRY